MEHNIGQYLHNVIVNRKPNGYKFPRKMRIQDKRTGKVFDSTYGGYDPKSNCHVYTLKNIDNGDLHCQTPEGYIEENCEILQVVEQ